MLIGLLINNDTNNNNFIYIAFISSAQGALQNHTLLIKIYKFTTISYYKSKAMCINL